MIRGKVSDRRFHSLNGLYYTSPVPMPRGPNSEAFLQGRGGTSILDAVPGPQTLLDIMLAEQCVMV